MKASLMGVSGSLAIGMLAAADIGDGVGFQPILDLHVWSVEAVAHPGDGVFRIELRFRRDRVGVVERADRHADARAGEVAVGQRRAAILAKAAFGDRRTLESFRRAPRAL